MEIASISSYWFLGILETAKKELVLVFPALHDEWLYCLQRIVQQKQLSLKICVNNTEESIRNGHGSALQFEKLRALNAELRQSINLKVQYLRCDDDAYFFFNESMIISEWGIGENAIQLSASSTRDFERSIFPDSTLIEAGTVEVQRKYLISESFNYAAAKEAADALKSNPPVAPDLRRQLNVYTTRFQFVEIEFKGSKFAYKKVKLPEKLLAVSDVDLLRSIESTLRVFDSRNDQIGLETRKLNNQLDRIKEGFLIKNPQKDKWVMQKADKLKMEERFNLLRVGVDEVKRSLVAALYAEIDKTKYKIEVELKRFFLLNTPRNLMLLSNEKREAAIEKEVSKLLEKIKFPVPESLLNDLELVVRYFDLTEEDLCDPEMISWFVQMGLLKKQEQAQLAEFKPAFYAK
jgi:hypothetical protein